MLNKMLRKVSRVSPFHGIPLLSDDHIKNCRIVMDRWRLLDLLPKGTTCAEVGVLHGEFSEDIIKRCDPNKIYLIDCNPDMIAATRKRLSEGGLAERADFNLGNSHVVLETFADGFFDWIYIDGDHTYDQVRLDLAVSARKIKTDGLLILNDYTFYDHMQGYRMGVIDATNEFCIRENWELVYFAFNKQMYCDVAIRKMR